MQLTGQVDVQMAAAGAGANATGHISYDERGSSRSRAPSPSISGGLTNQ